MNFIYAHNVSLECLEHGKKALVSTLCNAFFYLFVTFFFKNRKIKRRYADFCTAYGFHKCFFKRTSDCHNFAGCLHLRAEFSRRINEFVKREFREFYYNVIKDRLKAGSRFLCNEVWNFIKIVAYGDESRYFCNRVAGCL